MDAHGCLRKKKVCVCASQIKCPTILQELYGKTLKIQKHQDRLRAKGLFSKDTASM